MTKKIILLGMDGVVTDYEAGFLRAWREKHPALPSIPLHQRTTFYPREQYPRDLAEEISNSKSFYRNLPAMPGALEAIAEMSKNNEVFICTSPKTSNPYCVSEKFEWVQEYLGRAFLKKVIVAKDKTLVHGDILIDDMPHVTGIVKFPSWKHILYKQPFNSGCFTWENWQDFLK